MNTCPPVTVNGSPPRPTLTIVWPIRLSGPQVPCDACGSSQSFTEESMPSSPGGMCSWIACRVWLPSSRLIVIVNGVKPPAWMFVVPAVSDGAKGSGAAPGGPFGPDATSKDDAETDGSLLDHAVRLALVV